MAGYIGKSQGVTQVDGYNRTEADDRYVNASGDTMTGDLSTTGSIKATNGFLAGANNTYLYEGASNTLNIRIGETGPYAEFVDAGSGVLEIGNAGGRLSLTSNGIERIHLDDAGRVTMPYQPAFHAIYANGYAVTLGGGTRYALHGRALTNRGNHYNASTGYFTAPVSGVYAFSIGLAANATAHSSGFIVVEAEINGATKADLYSSSSDIIAQGEGGHSSVEWVVSLNAGDYFRPYYYTSVSYATGGGSNSWTQARNFFSGYLIG